MADLWTRFAAALRAHHVPVSVDELSDAVRVVDATTAADRDRLRMVLAATLIKRPEHRPVFERLFDLFFPSAVDRSARPPTDPETMAEVLAVRDPTRWRAAARQLIRAHGDVRSDVDLDADAFVFRALRGTNLDAVLDRLRDRAVEGRGLNALQRRALDAEVLQRIEQFRRMLRDEVFSALADDVGLAELSRRQRQPPPEEIDLRWARGSDLEAVRAAIAPLARRLATTMSHRRRNSRRGRLDVRRSLRRALSTGGAVVHPAFRRPRAGRPDLVVLVDISGSMRAFARFTLELTYALHTQFRRIRTFAFVDTTDDISAALTEATDLHRALERILDVADVSRLDGQSHYGHALARFWELAGDQLSPRTTVIVIADARTNFRPTGIEHLERIRDRVRAIHWLNPEPRDHWDTGDSAMGTFARTADAVYEVRTLAQLAAYVQSAV